MTAGIISSKRLLETQPQSNSLGPNSWKATGGLLTKLLTALPGFGSAAETPDGLYAEYAANSVFRVRDDDPALDAGSYELRECVPEGHPLAQAWQVPVAVGRVEVRVRDAQEREHLEDSVGAHERGDEL